VLEWRPAIEQIGGCWSLVEEESPNWQKKVHGRNFPVPADDLCLFEIQTFLSFRGKRYLQFFSGKYLESNERTHCQQYHNRKRFCWSKLPDWDSKLKSRHMLMVQWKTVVRYRVNFWDVPIFVVFANTLACCTVNKVCFQSKSSGTISLARALAFSQFFKWAINLIVHCYEEVK